MRTKAEFQRDLEKKLWDMRMYAQRRETVKRIIETEYKKWLEETGAVTEKEEQA